MGTKYDRIRDSQINFQISKSLPLMFSYLVLGLKRKNNKKEITTKPFPVVKL